MREYVDQNNSEYWHFLISVLCQTSIGYSVNELSLKHVYYTTNGSEILIENVKFFSSYKIYNNLPNILQQLHRLRPAFSSCRNQPTQL